VVVAAFFLSRQRDIKRMFAYSSVEHMGIMTFAFGMGGAVAAFAGLLHMTVHSLTKSAIFFTVGHASQAAGTQHMDSIRGLIQTSPTIGWGLALGSLAILGLPPFGVFTSEFMVLTTAMHEHSWATPFLLVALGVTFASIFGKVQPMVFGETTGQRLPRGPALVPVFTHLALGLPSGLLWVSVPLSREDPHYPGIADIYPSANRMQRATADLLGIIPSADADRRKWLRHGAWPEGAFPLRKNVDAAARLAQGPDRYPFIPVEGEGVHEIPVGTVHAGTIEPGHFRFSIVGEKILRLEERLGYKHKGVEKRFEQMTLEEGAKLAGRVSGDSTVAYAWAY